MNLVLDKLVSIDIQTGDIRTLVTLVACGAGLNYQQPLGVNYVLDSLPVW